MLFYWSIKGINNVSFPLKSSPEIITTHKQHNISIQPTVQRKIDADEGECHALWRRHRFSIILRFQNWISKARQSKFAAGVMHCRNVPFSPVLMALCSRHSRCAGRRAFGYEKSIFSRIFPSDVYKRRAICIYFPYRGMWLTFSRVLVDFLFFSLCVNRNNDQEDNR